MQPAIESLDIRPMARLFKALGDENRLRIAALLVHGELCVCHVESALSLTQPNASRLLAVLKNAGVVEPRREGNWIYYRLAPQADAFCKLQLKAFATALGKERLLRDDVERLLKTKGPAACR